MCNMEVSSAMLVKHNPHIGQCLDAHVLVCDTIHNVLEELSYHAYKSAWYFRMVQINMAAQSVSRSCYCGVDSDKCGSNVSSTELEST